MLCRVDKHHWSAMKKEGGGQYRECLFCGKRAGAPNEWGRDARGRLRD
jgi:hypothetical protein